MRWAILEMYSKSKLDQGTARLKHLSYITLKARPARSSHHPGTILLLERLLDVDPLLSYVYIAWMNVACAGYCQCSSTEFHINSSQQVVSVPRY